MRIKKEGEAMERIYNTQDAIKKMENSVKYYGCRIEAWEKVKRVYKKDGSNFKQFNKNFTNCKLVQEYGTNKIYIYFRNERGAYDSDWIILYDIDLESPEAVEEAEKKINEHIEDFKKWLEIAKKGAAAIADQIEEINPLLDKINNILKDADKNTNTGHTLKSYIKEYLRII